MCSNNINSNGSKSKDENVSSAFSEMHVKCIWLAWLLSAVPVMVQLYFCKDVRYH